MVWERIRSWLENPIFVKHLRSRLRLQALLSAIVVVQALCLCIAWAGFQLETFESGGAFNTLLLLQIIIIVGIGGSQVATAVGSSRTSGILDFHRVSPLSRDELTLGFFFGAPDPRVCSPGHDDPLRAALRGLWRSQRAWAHSGHDRAPGRRLALSGNRALELAACRSPASGSEGPPESSCSSSSYSRSSGRILSAVPAS